MLWWDFLTFCRSQPIRAQIRACGGGFSFLGSCDSTCCYRISVIWTPNKTKMFVDSYRVCSFSKLNNKRPQNGPQTLKMLEKQLLKWNFSKKHIAYKSRMVPRNIHEVFNVFKPQKVLSERLRIKLVRENTAPRRLISTLSAKIWITQLNVFQFSYNKITNLFISLERVKHVDFEYLHGFKLLFSFWIVKKGWNRRNSTILVQAEKMT